MIIKSLKVHNLVEDLKFEKLILTIMGIYPEKNENLWTWRKMRLVLLVTAFTIQKIQVVIQRLFDNSKDVTMSLPLTIEVASVLKLYILVYYSGALLKTEAILSELLLTTYQEECTVIEKHMKLTRLFTICNFCFNNIGICFFLFLEPVDRSKKRQEQHNAIPFSVVSDLWYLLIYVSHKCSVYLNAIVDVTIDCLFTKMAMMSSCLFDSLNFNLRSIDYENDISAEKYLKENICRHIEILRLVENINVIFNKTTFVQCLSSVLTLCSALIKVNGLTFGSQSFFGLCIFLSGMLLEISIYCFLGDVMNEKSDKISEALLMSNWYYADLSTRKLLLVIMEKTRVPFTIKAGGFFSLSLETLVSILKTSYSFWRLYSVVYA